MHPFALAPSGHHFCAAEVSKMARDFWLVNIQNFHQEAHADLISANQVDDPQAGPIREGFEQ